MANVGYSLRAIRNLIIEWWDKSDNAESTANEAKTTANTAKSTADTAITTSNEAKTQSQSAETKSDATQNQLDTVIIKSGTSDAETIQARGPFDILNDRLVASDQQLAQKANIEHVLMSVKWFGAKEDGITDDSQAVIDNINYLGAEGGIVYFPPDGICLINNLISIPDNVSLFGYNTKIKNTVALSADGLFNVVGSVEATKFNLSADALKGTDVLTFTTLPPVVAGDAILITQTGTTNENSFYESVSKIETVDTANNKITLESPLMHDYLTSLTATVQKAVLRKNVSIDGFEFEITHTQDLSPIRKWYTDNVKVRNIKAKGFGGSCVETDFSINFTIENISAKKPSVVDPGRGYAVKIHHGCSFGVITNVYGYKTRHTVDIAGGSHSISVVDCMGVKNTTQTFGLHGQHERNITFQGCKAIKALDGGFTMGNASYGRSEEVTLINCTAYFCKIGVNIALADNVTLVGFKSYFSTLLNYQVDSSNDVTINSSESVGGTSQIQRSTNVMVDISFSKIPTTVDPLWIFNDAKDIRVKGSIKNDARYGIQVGSTTAGHLPVEKINIGCDITSNGEFCVLVRANAKEVTINNSKLNAVLGVAMLLTVGAEKIVIKDNDVVGNIDNRVTKNIVIKDNVGSFSIVNTNTTSAIDGRWIEENYNWIV